jgi:DNA-binding transcriptional LysR family regulator
MAASADLNDILVFARVVQTGSFTAAARALQMPKSTVSRKITDLEQRLGVRLLQRTTRTLSLTDEGRTYNDYCARIVEEMDEAELAVGRLSAVPRGLLRVTTPLNFGFMGGIFADFASKNPEVTLEVVSTDRIVNLVEERFDVAVRAGTLSDSTLVARPLAKVRRVVVASGAYLKKRGRPRQPADLAEHECLVFGGGPAPSVWRLEKDGTGIDVTVKPRLLINDFDALLEAARAGVGIAMLPVFRCLEDVRTGRLEHLLKEWCSPQAVVHAVYPTARHLSPKVKAFVEHLQQKFTPPPWEIGPPP